MGYRGQAFSREIKERFSKTLEIIKRPRKYFWVPANVTDVSAYLTQLGYKIQDGFQVQPKRWVVERTLAWLGKYRRLSKDYEFKIEHSENLIYLAMIRIMVRRIVERHKI